MNVYDYARNRIKSEFSSKPDYSDDRIKREESWRLHTIDYYEKDSKESLKNAVTCPVRAYWYVQNDNEKIGIGFGIATLVFNLLLFLYRYGATDAPVSKLIITTAELFFGCFTGLCIYFIYRLVLRKLIRKTVFYVFLILYFIFSVPYLPVLFGYETTSIGDFYEAAEYREKYYVIMSLEPETSANRKEYTLPADIERRLEYSYTTDVTENYYGQTHGGDDVSIPVYRIIRLYFSNGGTLSFDYDDSYNFPERTAIYPNKESEVLDSDGSPYYITLTPNKVK